MPSSKTATPRATSSSNATRQPISHFFALLPSGLGGGTGSVVDMQAEETKFAVGIPTLGSLILTHSSTGQIPGLKDFAPEDRPNATIVFWTFRAMVGLGLLMIALAFLALLARVRGRLYSSRLVQRYALCMRTAAPTTWS